MPSSRPSGTGRGRVEKLFATWAGDDPAIRANWAVWNEMWQYSAHNDGARALVETSHRRWLEQIHDLIAEGVADGSIPADVDPWPAARRLAACVNEWGREVLLGLRTARDLHRDLVATAARELGPGQGRKGEGGMSAEPLRTLPAWVYRTPEFYRAERRAIWSREWLLVGHISQLTEPGDYVSMRIAGEPIAVVKGADGELRGVLERLPAPRGPDPRRRRQLRQGDPLPLPRLDVRPRRAAARRCPRRRASPGSTATRTASGPCTSASPPGSCSRTSRPSPSRSRTALGPFSEWLAPYRPERLVQLPNGIVRASHQLEELDRQLPRGLPRAGRPPRPACGCSTTRTTWSRRPTRNVSIARSPMRDKPSRDRRERLYQRLVRPMPGLRAPESEQWNFVFAFPGTTVNLYPDQIDFWLNYPLDERRTLTIWNAFRPPETSGRRDRLVRRLNSRINHLVQEEDNELTERVQEGLESSRYRAGVIGARENGIKHFHDLVRAAIPAAAADDEADGISALREAALA